MTTKGIRGAITVTENTSDAIKLATIELLTEIIKRNNVQVENISHVIFTLTNDLNAGLQNVAMICFHELDVPNSLPMCLRVLLVLNCETDFVPQFVYLKNASNLR